MSTQTSDPSFDPSFDPRSGAERARIAHSTPDEVAAALESARAAAPALAAASPALRREWLLAVAAALTENADRLVAIADAETALGSPRLPGEFAKALENAEFYASVAVEGTVFGATLDTEDETVTLARVNVPRGPVVVFGASNFPFQFGVFGHDTASALAAGCPVIAKAHPAHPELSAELGGLIGEALRSVGAPEGTFALVQGFEAGLAAVDHPATQAVAFTGSQRGGMALVERLAPRGVPVYAEMGTVNPVLALAGCDTDALVQGFVGSFTLGAGQFCTKPGLLLVPAGMGVAEKVAAEASALPAQTLLTAGIAAAFGDGCARLEAAGAHFVGDPASQGGGFSAVARVARVELDQLVAGSGLLEECFGPVALVAEYDDLDEALAALGRLQPSLAGSVFTGTDAHATSRAAAALAGQVGRVALNQWPTGVACTWAQQHGGPWPATSRVEASSVGAAALARFVRPVAFQNVPRAAADAVLPEAVRPSNPWGVPQRVNGRLGTR
ncbi:aldehyde dehydrogenase family protein [Micrococcales bacterium 31B]|nr:aldehyde dehydrogenase family protein [Micrococcales bacterium 31B]